MNVLVTGSTGGIGQWVARRLLEAGYAVRALDIKAQPISSGYEYLNGDVRDLARIRRAIHGVGVVSFTLVPLLY